MGRGWRGTSHPALDCPQSPANEGFKVPCQSAPHPGVEQPGYGRFGGGESPRLDLCGRRFEHGPSPLGWLGVLHTKPGAAWAWCRTRGPGQDGPCPRGMSWGGGGLLVKNGRATADGVTGRARTHEGSRRSQGPGAGTSGLAEGSRLSREQTARRLGVLGGVVVRPRRRPSRSRGHPTHA